MEGAKASPFPPVADVHAQRNPPLAPSQELAYRNKCIQLKKRLAEVEASNDMSRKKIATEKDRVNKQRLLRAVLLNQLREIMSTPGRSFKPEELERLGIVDNDNAEDESHQRTQDPDVLLDDSSEDSDDDNHESNDRPTRTRRQNNNYRGEAIMTQPAPSNPAVYQPPGLPNIAPATSFSPTTAREPLLTTSFQTPVPVAVSPPQYAVPQQQQQQQFVADPRYAHSSPIHPGPAQVQPLMTSQPRAVSLTQPVAPVQPDVNGYRSPATTIPQPVRPSAPYNQFCDHMRPQLEADNYPREHLQSRIDEEWRKLSIENRALWEDRYNEQMRDYEEQKDHWKRAQRRAGDATPIAARGPTFPAISR